MPLASTGHSGLDSYTPISVTGHHCSVINYEGKMRTLWEIMGAVWHQGLFAAQQFGGLFTSSTKWRPQPATPSPLQCQKLLSYLPKMTGGLI